MVLLWLITYGVIIFFAHRRRRKTGLTDEQIIITTGFSLAGIFALFKVLINVANFHRELQAKLDWDGITAVSIRCVLGIVIALKEIRKFL